MKKILCFLFSFVFLFLLCIPIYADDSVDITRTSVKEDLSSMEEDKLSYFSETEFIFIAMSQYYDLENKLRTYVYFNLPLSSEKYANSLKISLSTSVSDGDYNIVESYIDYELKFVDSSETWYKYEVLGLANLEQTTRRYRIKDIFVNDSIVDLKFSVDKVYIFWGINTNKIEVFKEEIETITITDKELVFYCYGDGDDWFFQETNVMNPKDVYTDSWFVFFNTDKHIDELFEVELTYYQYDYHLYRAYIGTNKKDEITYPLLAEMRNNQGLIGEDFSSGRSFVEFKEQTVTTIFPGTTKVSYTDNKWFGNYDIYYEDLDNIMDLKTYKEISTDTFVFTDYAEKYNWGVHFKDTERSFEEWDTSVAPMAINLSGSGMLDVAILRLKFKTNGVVKNCYAVDTPTSDFTGESADVDTEYEEMFEKMFMLIGALLIVAFVGYLLPVFKFVFEGVAAVVSFPFKVISRWFFGKK